VYNQIKKLSLQSVIYGVGHIMTRLVTFFLLPLYTNVFTEVEYGVISLAYAFIGFALILFRYGMDSALMKFYITDDLDEKQGVFSTIWTLQLISSVVFSLFIIGFSSSLSPIILGRDAGTTTTKLIAIILAMDVLWNLPVLILRNEERPGKFVGLNLFNVLMTIGFNFYFVVIMELGIHGVFYGNIAASGLMILVSFPLVIQRFKIRLLSKKLLKRILKFGLPFVPAGIFTMVMELADRYLLEWMVGTSAVGLYSAGYKLGMFGLLMVMGFNMGWTPFFLQKGKEKNAPEMFSRITNYFLAVYGLIAVILIFIIHDLVRLNIGSYSFLGEAFWSSTAIAPVIFLAYFFFGLYVLQLPAVYMPEKTKWVPVFRAVGAITNVGLNILVIPKYGALGAAWATVGAQAMMSLSIFIATRKEYKIPFRTIGIIIPFMAILGAMMLTGPAMVKTGYIIGYLLIWIFLVSDKKERRFLIQKIS